MSQATKLKTLEQAAVTEAEVITLAPATVVALAPAEVDVDLASYDHIIVAFSGGKDSLACFLRLLDLGVARDKIELWHHDVDGREGSTLMDWGCTASYCRAFAAAFGVRIFFSWKVGGFEGEMNRDESATAKTAFETPEGVEYRGGEGKPGTRLKFPQVAADLKVRWCSAYLKVDVGATALRNQERFNNRRVLFVTGERAAESKSRSRYKRFEPHRADARDGRLKRHVDQWRPVHAWSEREVWDIIEKHSVNPHPAYRMGWGRVSCAACIFGSANQWASLKKVSPAQFEKVAEYEEKFGLTIQRTQSVRQLAKKGKPYKGISTKDVEAAIGREFSEPIIVAEGEWVLPAGAFGDGCGPV